MSKANSTNYQDRIDNAQETGNEFIYGILVGVGLVALATWAGSLLFSDTEGYLTNIFTEILSVIATIFIIDRINQWRTDQQLRRQLLDQTKATSLSPAVNALNRLRREHWLESNYFTCNNLYRAYWEGAYIGGLNFEKSNLIDANFSYVTTQDLQRNESIVTNFNNTLLHSITLNNSHIFHSTFHYAEMSFANLENSTLMDCDFRGANLLGANMKNIDLVDINFEGSYLERVKLNEAKLNTVNLKGAILKNAHIPISSVFHYVNVILPDGKLLHNYEDFDRFINPNNSLYLETLEKVNEIRLELGYKDILH